MHHPRAGAHYPRSVGEFHAWFPTDSDCLDFLEWLRWRPERLEPTQVIDRQTCEKTLVQTYLDLAHL